MALSQRNIIIAGAAAVAVIIIIAVVVISRRDPGPVKSGIFTRCDGRQDPIDEIKISACAGDNSKTGLCEIAADKETKVEFSFTAAKDFSQSKLFMKGPINPTPTSYDICATPPCPLKKDEKNNVSKTFTANTFTKVESGEVVMNITDTQEKVNSDKAEMIYCVSFPVKVV